MKGKLMTNQRTWTAEVTDPTTGQITVISASSENELDRLVDEHLAAAFDLPANHEPGIGRHPTNGG